MARFFIFLVMVAVFAGGVAGGLGLAWQVFPNVPIGYAPSALRTDAKEDYIEMVASAYVAEQDVRLAQSRLDLLKADNLRLWVSERARQAAAADEGLRAFRLANLALVAGADDIQMLQLARPALQESRDWRWVEQSLLRCDQLTQPERQPFLRLRVQNVRAQPIPDVSAKLTLYTGGEVTLRTDGQGIAQAPFTGEGIQVYAPDLEATCTAERAAAPHGVEVIVRSK
jgi:hypothetical protein